MEQVALQIDTRSLLVKLARCAGFFVVKNWMDCTIIETSSSFTRITSRVKK
jgi:hypothetical protein